MMNRKLVFAAITTIAILILATAVSVLRNAETRKAKYLDRGEAYLAAGRAREAVIEFKSAIQLDGKSGIAYYKLGLAYLQLGEPREAFVAFSQSTALDGNLIQSQIALASLYLQEGRSNLAEAKARLVLSKDPENVDARLLLAQSYAGMKRWDGAFEEARKAIDLSERLRSERLLGLSDERASKPYLVLAALYLVKGDQSKAERVYRQALAANPTSVEAAGALGAFLVRARRPAEAEKVFAAAAEANPQDGRPLLALGDLYKWQGRASAAMVQYQKAETAAPKATEPLHRQAELLLAQRKLEQATPIIDRGLKLNPADPIGHDLKGLLYLARNQPKDAIVAFQAAIHAAPRFVGAGYHLALAHLAAGDVEAAKARLRDVLALTPRHTEARLVLARLYLQAGDRQSAEREVQAAITFEPTSGTAHLFLGDLKLQQSDLPKALAHYTRAIELAPKHPIGYYKRGLAYRAIKRYDAAVSDQEQALILNPDLMEALSEIAAIHTMQGRRARAIARVTAQIGRSPRNALMYDLLGLLQMRQNRLDEAETSFEKAIELSPNVISSYYYLASLYARQKAFDKAIAKFEAALRVNPNSETLYTLKGMIYGQQGKLKEAKDAYERALAVNPGAPVAANNLAWWLAEEGGNLRRASELAQLARKALPDSPEVADTLGWIYYKMNRLPEAIPLLVVSVNGHPDEAAVHYRLGMAYNKAGHTEKAKLELETALKLNATFKGADEAREALNWLKRK